MYLAGLFGPVDRRSLESEAEVNFTVNDSKILVIL